MAWRPKGRASVSTSNPRAFGVCDRCSRWYNHDKLQWQFDWAGPRLMDKRILVCRTCLDVPQQQLRTITLPPDPVPIQNPRPEPFFQDYVTHLLLEDGTPFLTEGGEFLYTENSSPPAATP